MSTALNNESTIELPESVIEMLDKEFSTPENLSPSGNTAPETTPDSTSEKQPQDKEQSSSGNPPEPNLETKEEKPGQTKPEETKPKSKYASEKERRDNSWSELNRKKEEFEKDQESKRADIEKRERDLESKRADIEKQQAELKKSKFTPEQYEKAAERFESEGKFDMADEARAEANRLREDPNGVREAFELKQKQSRAEFENFQRQSAARAVSDFPELGKQGSQLQADFLKFVNLHPSVMEHRDGPYLAAKFVKSQMESSRLPELEKSLSEAQKRIKELEQQTKFTSSAPTQPPSSKSKFEDLSFDDMMQSIGRDMGAFA